MTLLLDTHSFLWFCQDDPSLSAAAKAVIEDPFDQLLIAQARMEGISRERRRSL